MSKKIEAKDAYAKYVELKNKPQKVTLINGCPDCMGTGHIGKTTCPTCGNEPDDPTLVKRGGYWFRPASA